jgi:hypothetical protein
VLRVQRVRSTRPLAQVTLLRKFMLPDLGAWIETNGSSRSPR